MANKAFEGFKAKAKELRYYIAALYLAYKRRETPLIAKIVMAVAIGYALSPIDLIPDFIPILGYLDDLVILPLLIALSLKLTPKEIISECKEEAKELWKNGGPKKWYYAVPIIAIYLVIMYIIIKNIIKLWAGDVVESVGVSG